MTIVTNIKRNLNEIIILIWILFVELEIILYQISVNQHEFTRHSGTSHMEQIHIFK